MKLILNQNSPWKIMDIISGIPENGVIEIQTVIYSKTTQTAFLYSNIIENSYINGKLSRLLSIIPHYVLIKSLDALLNNKNKFGRTKHCERCLTVLQHRNYLTNTWSSVKTSNCRE